MMACGWKELAFLATALTHKRDLVLYLMASQMRALRRTSRGRSGVGISKISLAFLSVIAISSNVPFSTPGAFAASEKARVEATQSVDVNEEKIGDKNFQVSKILVNVKPE